MKELRKRLAQLASNRVRRRRVTLYAVVALAMLVSIWRDPLLSYAGLLLEGRAAVESVLDQAREKGAKIGFVATPADEKGYHYFVDGVAGKDVVEIAIVHGRDLAMGRLFGKAQEAGLWIGPAPGALAGYSSRIWESLAGTLGFAAILILGGCFYSAFVNLGSAVERPQSSYADIGGYRDEKREIKDIIDLLVRETQGLAGERIPSGVLLAGPPGTGKTSLVKAAAGEAGVCFLFASGADFDQMFIGLGALRIRRLFAQARASAPCILFIDEIDTLGARRRETPGESRFANQTLTQLLSELGGIKSLDGVLVIGATNRPELLDEALMRPGRLERHVSIGLPDMPSRLEILQLYGRKMKVLETLDLETIARSTSQFSGAQLEALMNGAATAARERHASVIEQQDLSAAIDRVLLGRVRSGIKLDEVERWQTAVHEAGHALCSTRFPEMHAIRMATIMPRDKALGAVARYAEKDHLFVPLSWIRNEIAITMAGREAERLVLGEDRISTGAANDITQATTLAMRLVTEWGGNDRIGPVALSQIVPAEAKGAELAMLVQGEVRAIIAAESARAFDILEAHREALERLADALLERETLTGDQIREIVGSVGQVADHRATEGVQKILDARKVV